jgi:hypothetical protein
VDREERYNDLLKVRKLVPISEQMLAGFCLLRTQLQRELGNCEASSGDKI